MVPDHPNAPAVIVSASGHIHIHTAIPAKCDLCGVVEELRPYGPGGKNICFGCMMKNPKEAKKRFHQQFK